MFPYLGNFLDILPYKDVIEFTKTANWTLASSSDGCFGQERGEVTRPDFDIETLKHYNRNNSLRHEVYVRDQNFFPDEWFSRIGAKKEGHSSKIFLTIPGHFEPPHIDYYPSFMGNYNSEGKPFTAEEIAELSKKIIRVWIPLEDSKLGHVLYSDEYALSSWKQGDAFELPAGVIHGFANGGRENRLLWVCTAWRS